MQVEREGGGDGVLVAFVSLNFLEVRVASSLPVLPKPGPREPTDLVLADTTLAGYPRNSLELSNDSSFLLALLLRDFVATPFQVCWGGEIFTTKLSAQVLLISQPEPLLTYGEPWMGLLNHSCLAQITWYVIHPAFKALGSPH